MDSRPILIAGAGIGGLAAAVALRRAGFEVEIFERAGQLREIGAGITLWINAMTALRRLGLEDRIRELSAPLDRNEIWSWKGHMLTRVSVVELARELGAQPVGIERGKLLSVLHEAVGDTPIHLENRVIGYGQNGNGVVARLANGREVEGSLLIGADGLRSAVRAQLLQDGEPLYTGATVWRGISDTSEGTAPGSVFMTFGPKGVRGGAWFVDDRCVSWFVGINAPPGTRNGGEPMKPALLKRVSKFSGPIPGLVARTPEERIHQTDVYVRRPCDKWGEGRVTLLGDAAHAMGTVLGQGGAQALEDGVHLADSLRRVADPIAGLRLYEQRRIPRTRAVTDAINEVGRFVGLQNPIACWLRDMLLPRMSPDRSLDRMRRVMTFAD